MTKQIETNTRTFVKFWMIPVIIAVFFLFIEKAATGLVIIGISIFLALALKPLVRAVNNFFTKHFGKDKKHQTLSAVMAYLIVVIIVGGIIAVIGPVVVNETSKFINNFPEMFEHTFGGWDGVNSLGKNFGISDLHSEIQNALTNLSNTIMGAVGPNLISSVGGVASIIMNIVLVLILTLLILLEGPKILDDMWNWLGGRDKNNESVKEGRRVVMRMADVVSTYVSRQIMIAILDGCATIVIVFILSLILGISPSLAIPMGMITMLFYMIPMFGQFIGGTLVTLLLFFSNPIAGGVFAIIYILYTQVENNVISPKIQGSALNLSPLIILCAVTIGMYMFGLLGAIIAIPIAGCIRVLIEEYPRMRASKEQ